MNAKGLLVLAAAFGLAGCAASAVQPQASCELMTAQICSKAAEAQLSEGAMAVSYTPRAGRCAGSAVRRAGVQDGRRAGGGSGLLRQHEFAHVLDGATEIAIAPSSDESVEFLRGQHLCADDGAYADGAAPGAGLLADGRR